MGFPINRHSSLFHYFQKGGLGLAAKLEDSETSLEDSFRFYKEGMELLKYCSGRLDTVEKKMLQMDEDGTLREF